MDPVLLTSIIANTLKLAADASSLALQSGTLSADEVQKIWDGQRADWSRDWADWLARQTASPV